MLDSMSFDRIVATLVRNYASQTLTAVGRLVRAVAAVVLRVAFPPERDALVVLAHKLQRRDEMKRLSAAERQQRWHAVRFAVPLYLAGRAVGHAGALVTGKVEVGWTGALVAAAGGEQAEVAAAAVVGLARVVEHWAGGSGRERERER